MVKLRRLFLRVVMVTVAVFAGAAAGTAEGAGAPIVYKIGAVTWHAARFINQDLVLMGYVLSRGDGYVLFSDEPGGSVSAHDLPVAGAGLDVLLPKVKYILRGHFERSGLPASNGNLYRLVLSSLPQKSD